MNLVEAKLIVAEAVRNNASTLSLCSLYSSGMLFDSDLKELLPDIVKLKSLTSLDLSGNRINDYSFLKDLKSLNSLTASTSILSGKLHRNFIYNRFTYNLSKNPDVYDILFNSVSGIIKNLKNKVNFNRNDIDDIILFYEQLKLEGKDYIYEAKVLIVGEPMSGKTTLFKKLQNPDFNPLTATEEEKDQTVGVDIEIIEFPFDEEKTFKAHLWDFGGHEKQYALHQYFFTERSLYILLADDRKELGNFNYWFEIIATLGSGCPVLVVLNEINSKVKNFDISVYKKEFGEKIEYIEEKSVNFANNNDGRFTDLANEIKTKLKRLYHIGQPLPKTWVKVRQELTEIKEPIISIDDYHKICEKSGVENLEYRKQILEYLHALGIALNYKYDDNLRYKLILKPNWVIDALYAVLKDERIIKNAGKFSAIEIFDLWNNYKADEKTILLQLMQKGKFEVVYKLEGKNVYIVPILLPDIAPEYPFDETDSLQVNFEYIFKPKGIISRLIVRLHENIVVNKENGEQIVWKKGVFLKHKNSFARVIESEQRRTITISVSGKSAVENREFITIISNEIKRIHRDWFEDRLQFKEKIPCYCEVCKTETEPQLYELETVESYYEINEEIVCNKSVKARSLIHVNPRKLLEGVYIIEPRSEVNDLTNKSIVINGNINISNTIGDNNTSILGVKDSEINIGKLINDVSSKMNESQRQTMEELANEIIFRIEGKEKLNNDKQNELEDAKKGKWETKIKFSLPFIPLEFSRSIPPDEFITKVQKWLYGGDLQKNILQAKEEVKGFLSE